MYNVSIAVWVMRVDLYGKPENHRPRARVGIEHVDTLKSSYLQHHVF